MRITKTLVRAERSSVDRAGCCRKLGSLMAAFDLLLTVTLVSSCLPAWSKKVNGLEPIAPLITVANATNVSTLQPEL